MPQFTPREKEVFDLIVMGKSITEIAAVNNVTVQTIRKQCRQSAQKDGCED